MTSIAGVPFTYECLRRLKFTAMDLPDLTLMIQAGGKLSKKLQKEFGEYAAGTGKRFVVMYGQTEATARMSYLPPADCLRKIGSIGIAIPGGSFSILDDDHAELTKPNAIGELCYDGPNVSLGYAHCADDLQLGDERHGRLFTGDIAYCDEEGFYYIAGRKKRFVKIMGKRVNMDEVEQLFKTPSPTGISPAPAATTTCSSLRRLRKRTAPTWRISSSPRRAFIPAALPSALSPRFPKTRRARRSIRTCPA